jgi:hypothetical protein
MARGSRSTTVNRHLLIDRPGAVSVRLVLRLLTVSRDVRAWVVHGVHASPGAGASFATGEAHVHQQHVEAGFLDAAAGGEFVDDRIRRPD